MVKEVLILNKKRVKPYQQYDAHKRVNNHAGHQCFKPC